MPYQGGDSPDAHRSVTDGSRAWSNGTVWSEAQASEEHDPAEARVLETFHAHVEEVIIIVSSVGKTQLVSKHFLVHFSKL